MKIAIVTDDGEKISTHFGRAMKYAVLTVENGCVTARELRDKASHLDFAGEAEHEPEHHDDSRGRGFGQHSEHKHLQMLAVITDCQIVLARGMGQGVYNRLQETGVRPNLTDIIDVEMAVQAVIDGSIMDHPERLH